MIKNNEKHSQFSLLFFYPPSIDFWASQVAQWVKNPPANAGNAGSIPVLGRSPGGRHGNLLQDSCLRNPKDRGAWRAAVCGIAKTWTWLGTHMHTCNPLNLINSKSVNHVITNYITWAEAQKSYDLNNCKMRGYRVSVWEDEKVLEIDGHVGCMMIWMSRMPLKCTLRSV